MPAPLATFARSQARPVSARPTMAALLEKMPPDYALATCPEKASEDTIKVRPVVPEKPEDITSRMPADWRQQLLRHIEAKRLDRVRKCTRHTEGGGRTNPQTHPILRLFPVCICLSLCCKDEELSVQLHECSIHTVALTFCTTVPEPVLTEITWPEIQLSLNKWFSIIYIFLKFVYVAFLKVESLEINCSESKGTLIRDALEVGKKNIEGEIYCRAVIKQSVVWSYGFAIF